MKAITRRPEQHKHLREMRIKRAAPDAVALVRRFLDGGLFAIVSKHSRLFAAAPIDYLYAPEESIITREELPVYLSFHHRGLFDGWRAGKLTTEDVKLIAHGLEAFLSGRYSR
jgi:hypothetical protein